MFTRQKKKRVEISASSDKLKPEALADNNKLVFCTLLKKGKKPQQNQQTNKHTPPKLLSTESIKG